MPAPPSNRSSGLTFAVVFALVGLAPVAEGEPARAWPLVVSGILAALALAAPALLRPLTILWFRIGLALHRVVHPIVMGLIFYVVITPAGLARRRFSGSVARQLRRDPGAPSYWVRRDGSFSSMDQQF